MTTLKFMGSALTATLLAQPAAAQVPYSPRGEILSAPIVIGQVPRIIAKVTGPVCDLCEDTLKRAFSQEAVVDYIHVDFQTGTVQITLKFKQTMSDDRLAQILRNTGYVLLATTREGGA